MALPDLTVNEFLFEILNSMKVPSFKPNTRTKIGFYGKSAKFPMYVQGSELMEKVYKKICSIESQREMSLNAASFNEELASANRGEAAH